ncbi:MAG TPA: SHOCT domain-containing protein [Flavipsychrobacter sp.]|nr:SHOCT domain-containing protein [Flavipsychrobacter sp.]
MSTINERKKDAIIITLIIISFLDFFTFLVIDTPSIRIGIVLSFLLSIAAAFIGKDRRIGGVYAVIATFFLSVLGFIIVLASPRLKDEEYKEKLLDNASKKDALDHLIKLNELKKEGILTEEEFAIQKKKILDEQ